MNPVIRFSFVCTLMAACTSAASSKTTTRRLPITRITRSIDLFPPVKSMNRKRSNLLEETEQRRLDKANTTDAPTTSPPTSAPISAPTNKPTSDDSKKDEPPKDPCEGKETCTECKEAAKTSGLDGETCYWKKGSCSKVKGERDDQMCDPCAGKKTCGACQNATSKLDDQDHEICLWQNDKCKKTEKAGQSTEIMCGEKPDEGGGGGEEEQQQEEESGSSHTMVIVLIIIVGAVYYWFRKRRATAASRHGDAPGPTRFHKSAVYEGISTHEQDEVDDWDWEDDGGDVELAGSRKMSPAKVSPPGGRYQDEILPNTYAQEDSRLVRRTPSNDGMEVPGLSVQNAPKATTMMASQFHATGGALPSVSPQRITKLGSPVNRSQKKPKPAAPPPKKQDDDIFAEMGLAAKPNFSHSAATRPTSRTLGATQLPPDDDIKDGTDWGDDSDLDDLLND